MNTFNEAITNVLSIYQHRDSRARVREDHDELANQLDNLSGKNPTEIINTVTKLYFNNNPNNSAPGNISRLFTEPLPIAKIGAIISILGNNASGTAKSNPFAAVAAELVFQFMIKHIYDRTTAEAIDVPAGMAGVNMGIKLGRNFLYPKVKDEGMTNVKLIVITSDQSHYSVMSAAEDLGIGKKNVIKIKTDASGAMDLEQLEIALNYYTKKGYKVIISSTMGTTVLGGIDNIKAINILRDTYNCWHNVDGSWGGVIPLGPDAHLVDGLCDVDSLTVDAHKALRSTLTCAIVMTRKIGLLADTNYMKEGANYLYNSNKGLDIDNGKRSMECGKPDRLLPIFLIIVILKKSGLRKMVHDYYEKAADFAKRVTDSEYFNLMHEPSFLNVCIQITSPLDDTSDSVFTEKVQENILSQKKSKIMIELCEETISGEKVLRCIFIQPSMTVEYMDTFLDQLIQVRNRVKNQIINTKQSVS